MERVDADEVASYIDAINITLSEGSIKDQEVINVIKSLPSASHVRRHLSNEEASIVFETIRWIWKKETGKDIVDSFNYETKESLMGNYWVLRNGVMLHGVNHYGIIKRNLTLFAELLDIDPFVMHHKLAGHPMDLVKLVIDHGGMRVFITPDKRAFFQVNDKVYAKWGRAKVKKFDFKKKCVKLIDPSINFEGWKSGIPVLL